MGCSCGSVGLTRGLAVLGIIMSGLVIAPPAYAYFSGRDLSVLLPFLKTLQEKLQDEFHKKTITKTSLEDLQSLLNGCGENAGLGGMVVVCVAAANILMDVLLLIGACCHVRCLLLPWLVLAMMEIVILGCPTVIFFSLLGVYLLRQGLFLSAIFSFSTPTVLVLIAMAVWLTVLAAYWALGRQNRREEESTPSSQDSESVQPLMYNEGGQSGNSYNLGQYPQYYPPHSSQQQPQQPQQHQYQGPSAPPQMTPPDKNNPNLYPTLPIT